MSVGFPLTRLDYDNRAGMLALQMRNLLDDIQHFQANNIAAYTDAQLIAMPSGGSQFEQYVQADVTLLRNAFTQLDAGRLVLTGQQTVTTANNFLFWANQITGTQ